MDTPKPPEAVSRPVPDPGPSSRDRASGAVVLPLDRRAVAGYANDPHREPVRLDRTNTAFHDLHRLARLFLTGEWQSTAGGRAAGCSP